MSDFYFDIENKKICLTENTSVTAIFLMERIIMQMHQIHPLSYIDKHHDLIWEKYQEAMRKIEENRNE